MAFHGKTKSDLVVTVRNGKRQCFLKENGDNKSNSGTNFKKDFNFESTQYRDSSVQVTDGRYASTYQISHCHVFPTSPSEELTEFPLQQKLLNSGDSHFKVGTNCKNVPRSSEPLRRDNPNAIENMPRLKHTDEFLSSLRKYSKPSSNRNLKITEKNNGGKHAKNPLTKDASSSANKTDEPLALEERSQCNNFISKGKAQKCEISKWLRQNRAKHGTKPSFATAIDVRELQKSTREDKESLRSVTLPNIAYSIDPSFFLQEEIEADTISPELNANNIQILQDMQFIKQNRKETEIQTEINTVSDANKITLVKNGLEMLEPHHINNHTGYNYKTSNLVTAMENKCFNVNLDIPNYQQVFPESNDLKSNSNDEFLKDAIKRWVHLILFKAGRCNDHDELNFVFQYLFKHLKILKNYNYFILNSKSQYTLKTIPCVNDDDLLSTIVSDENDNNNMTMVIERLTDMLMEKIRLIYKKQFTGVHNNTVKRNLRCNEILPTLGDDFYKEINFQKGLFNVDLYPETEKKIIKESDSNNTSPSFSGIQIAIQDWLDLLDLPQDLQNYKNIAIVSLASEIKKRIDRQNYIKSRSPSHIVSDEIELEYFRYLIFKWNNKYFPKERIQILENIKTLFYSIRKLNSKKYGVNKNNFDGIDPINVVAYPVLTQDNFYSDNKNNTKCPETHFNKMYSTYPICLVRNRLNQKAKCIQSLSNDKNVSIEYDPYEEYDQFVKLWSQEITKDLFTPQEANVAEKAALGIYNGVWKAIVKLNYKESIYHEYYEDFLEKEIDELIDCLPQTPQLRSIRHVLKVGLVEKTMMTLKYICKDRVTSLKNKLILKIQDYLGTLKFDVDNFKSINPCLTNIAEIYILWTKYSNENQDIARAYKNKVSTEIGKIYHILKQKYEKELDTLNIETFFEKFVNELREINISNDMLLEEADKVLLGQEIDQWFFDLSLTSEDVFEDEDHKKIMKDILVALVKETENNIDMNDDDKKSKLHSDIRNILKTNLIKEENLNKDFLASEFINRIDNMRQLCPRNIQLSIVPNENSLSFAERITKYKLGLHEKQHNSLAYNTLKQMSDNTVTNSTLNTCSAYKEPSTSIIKNNNVKWHTLHENMIHSDNSENSMKTAIDLEVPHANSSSKIDHQTSEPEKISKKCSCKISTCSLRNLLYIHDEENSVPINQFNDNSKIVLKVLEPQHECEDTQKDTSENSNRNSKRGHQIDLNLIDKSNKIPFSYGRENSRDIGVNVLFNDGMCNCMVGALEPNSDVPNSKGCQCTHRFRNNKSVFHSQTENGEHPAFIPVLYPYHLFDYM